MKEKQEIQKGLGQLLFSFAKASNVFAADWPKRYRPLVKTLFCLFMTISFLILAPFLIILKLFRYKSKSDKTYDKLNQKLEEIWHEQSPMAAIDELSRVYDILYAYLTEDKLALNVTIDPYGEFDVSQQYSHISQRLYHWEVQRNNWIRAKEICQNLLNIMEIEKRYRIKGHEFWIIRKAKCLLNLDGKPAAEEYLMKFLDNENTDSEINQYLFELRKT